MLGKRIFCVVLAVGLSALPALAEEQAVAQKSTLEVITGNMPKAAADVLTFDGVSYIALAGMGLMPWTFLPAYALGRFSGQLFRHSCKEIFTEGKGSVACGAIAGMIQYGSRSYLIGKDVLLKMAVGAFDVGLYEMDGAGFGQAIGGKEIFHTFGRFGMHESANNMFEILATVYRLGSIEKFVESGEGLTSAAEGLISTSAAKELLALCAVLTGTAFTTANLEEPVKDGIHGMFAGNTTDADKKWHDDHTKDLEVNL